MSAETILAARPGTTGLYDAVFWIGAAIIAIIAGAAILCFIRKIALEKRPRTGPGLPVEDIQRLHSQGLLSDEEYKRARRVALGLGVRDGTVAGKGAVGGDSQDGGPPGGQQPAESDDSGT